MAQEAYCMKCRGKREVKDPVVWTQANNRQAVKGKCAECGTGVNRILGKAELAAMAEAAP